MQCACVIFSTVAYSALKYSSTLSHTCQDFRKKVTENKMCILILTKKLSETFLIVRRTERDNYVCLHVKYSLFLSSFKEN
jgi:hypothetical protein